MSDPRQSTGVTTPTDPITGEPIRNPEDRARHAAKRSEAQQERHDEAQMRKHIADAAAIESQTATCRSCEQPIIWTVTASKGKKMPVDAGMTTEHTPRFKLTVLGRRGPIRASYVDAHEQRMNEPGHASHFATCPNADKHRKAVKS